MVDVSGLENVVDFMRKHGVTRLAYKGLELQLGAVPAPIAEHKPKLTKDELDESERQRRHSVMFAGSNVRPVLLPRRKA